MKQVIVTTSWDDGHKLDVRLSALLLKYHMKGTFYISPRDHEILPEDRLDESQLKKLAEHFEIGAHTMTHPRLTEVDDKRAKKEMQDSKKYLEDLLRRPVTTFCYPGGNFKAKHTAMAREVGFSYARTVRRHRFDLKGSLLEGDTTINAYNHYQDLWKIAKFARFNPVRTYRYFQWDVLAKAMFDKTLKEGGVYHLWGHSWEVDKLGFWEKLEDVLKYISDKKDVQYVTNGELPALQPKRILLAASYFPPHLGGVEFYVYNTARFLTSLGWEVVIATSDTSSGFKAKKTLYKGMIVYRLPSMLRLSNTPLNLFWSGMIRKILKDEDIYLVNMHAPVPGLPDMAAAVARKAKVPYVVTYHMMSLAKGKSSVDWLIGIYERKVLPKMLGSASAIICASDTVQKFLKAYENKSSVITPGVDINLFKPAKRLPENALLYVGSVARSDGHKGISVLLRAMRTVVAECPDVHLTLVGAGDGIAAYEETAKKYGIADHVTFTGGLYDHDLHEAYRKASVFVLPTFNDSFAMVVIEAMASGLPVVSSPIGAIPKNVKDGENGYLVKPGDADMLAKKLIYLLKNPKMAEAFGKRGRQRSEQGFAWEFKVKDADEVLLAALHDTCRGVMV